MEGYGPIGDYTRHINWTERVTGGMVAPAYTFVILQLITYTKLEINHTKSKKSN